MAHGRSATKGEAPPFPAPVLVCAANSNQSTPFFSTGTVSVARNAMAATTKKSLFVVLLSVVACSLISTVLAAPRPLVGPTRQSGYFDLRPIPGADEFVAAADDGAHGRELFHWNGTNLNLLFDILPGIVRAMLLSGLPRRFGNLTFSSAPVRAVDTLAHSQYSPIDRLYSLGAQVMRPLVPTWDCYIRVPFPNRLPTIYSLCTRHFPGPPSNSSPPLTPKPFFWYQMALARRGGKATVRSVGRVRVFFVFFIPVSVASSSDSLFAFPAMLSTTDWLAERNTAPAFATSCLNRGFLRHCVGLLDDCDLYSFDGSQITRAVDLDRDASGSGLDQAPYGLVCTGSTLAFVGQLFGSTSGQEIILYNGTSSSVRFSLHAILFYSILFCSTYMPFLF